MRYLFCLLLLVIIGPLQAEVVETARFYRYRDIQNGFSIDLPKNWELMDNATAVFMAAIPIKNEPLKFRPNVNLIIDVLEEEYSLDQLFQANVSYAESLLRQFRIHKIEEVMLDGVAAMKMVYSCRLITKGVVFDVKNTVYCAVYGLRFYILTCSMLQEQFDAYDPVFSRIGKSLQLF